MRVLAEQRGTRGHHLLGPVVSLEIGVPCEPSVLHGGLAARMPHVFCEELCATHGTGPERPLSFVFIARIFFAHTGVDSLTRAARLPKCDLRAQPTHR